MVECNVLIISLLCNLHRAYKRAVNYISACYIASCVALALVRNMKEADSKGG